MARPTREFPLHGVFHVLARGNNRAAVFHEHGDYVAYLGILRNILLDLPIQIHHYCLMPNHIHLLVSAGPPASALSEFMQRLQQSYTIYYKARYEFSGHLWQGRFKSLWVETEMYFLTCSAYIELNPVAAELVTAPSDYPFSSYRVYAEGAGVAWIVPHLIYEQLGSTSSQRQEAYRTLVAQRTGSRESDRPTVGFPLAAGRPKKGRP